MTSSIRSLARPRAVSFKPFNLGDVLFNNLNYPRVASFQLAVRELASNRHHSKEEMELFFTVFERGIFSESHDQSNVVLLPLSETIRYARRAFWKLVALDRSKAAARVIDMVSVILGIAVERHQACSFDSKGNKQHKENVLTVVAKCRDRLALFLCERYLHADVGRDFFSGQTFKMFLACTHKATSVVRVQVITSLLQFFQKRLELRGFHKPFVGQSDWVEIRLVFLMLIGLGKLQLSRGILRAVGQLLKSLAQEKFCHNEFSTRELPDYLTADEVKIQEYLASIQTVLEYTHTWLCGKPLFDANKGERIKLFFY